MIQLAFIHLAARGVFFLLFIGMGACVVAAAVMFVAWLAAPDRGRSNGGLDDRLKVIEEKLDRLNKPAP